MRIDGWIIAGESWDSMVCEFTTDPADPFAVSVRFGDVVWLMGRELLQAGLDRPTGQGDVRIWPTHGPIGALFIHLHAPSGEALIELPRARVRDFLASWPPAPVPDMDAELRHILDHP